MEFVDIRWQGATVRIEHRWIGHRRADRPVMVFLHEGLGSQAMWKDFPDRLCEAIDACGLVYSRPGYGRSTPVAPEEAWGVDFLHRQAHEVLPAFLQALDVRRPWLFGHSDGGSIALLYAAKYPGEVSGLVVVAPHIVVEDLSIASIREARTAYLETDMRKKLAKYHDDPDRAFWRWNRIWLHPPFREWSIEAEIGTIACPVLAVQGLDDEYGTLAQIRGIGRLVPGTEQLELSECGHSPHRDQPDRLIAATSDFFRRHTNRGAPR